MFRWVPFVDFVLGAGSMATGDVAHDSDFDVIVGARVGRIFTVRFLSALFLGIVGARRKRLSHEDAAANKICLNHFVTRSAYMLRPPYDASWKKLYTNLVPILGEPKTINAFFAANADWMGERRELAADLRHRHTTPNICGRTLAALLRGKAGDCVERLLRRAQIWRIERSLAHDTPGYKPRIIYTDNELEFHPDTRKFEQ